MRLFPACLSPPRVAPWCVTGCTAELEAIRQDASISVSRFCELLGVPRATWYRWQRTSDKGPWPSPVVEGIEPAVEKYAGAWPAWGHRKIWAMMRADGYEVSASSVLRAMARRNLLQPTLYQRGRRDLARARREAFIEAPPGETGSGRRTSRSSRPKAAAPGACRGSATTSPRSCSPAAPQ